MHVLLIQVDGKLPNLALMKLAHWYRSLGNTVTLIRRRRRDLFDPFYDKVYASAIFSDSEKFFPQILSDWPNTIFGGTGTTNRLTVESDAITNITTTKTIPISENPLASQNVDAV
jgi:hypothetical protein